MPDRTILRWEPILPRDEPRGELDVTWRWKLVVGRAKDCDVVLNHKSIPKQHGHFIRHCNEWVVENYEGSNGIYIKGRRILLEPVNGEDVDFAMLVRFAFHQAPMGPEEAAFREAIRAAPTDDSRYLVYADWLLERDDELGRLMVAPAPVAARYLGQLQSPGIHVTWRHGFFGAVRVESSKGLFQKGTVFTEVLAHPLAAFLTTLEADAVALEDETPECSDEHWVDYLFDSLLTNPPPTLRQLKVRLPKGKALRFQGELKALKLKLPLLQTQWETLFTDGALA